MSILDQMLSNIKKSRVIRITLTAAQAKRMDFLDSKKYPKWSNENTIIFRTIIH